MRRLADDNIRIHLAISLHIADNELRTTLMPINTTNPLPQLSEALKYYYQKQNCVFLSDIFTKQHQRQHKRCTIIISHFCKIFP